MATAAKKKPAKARPKRERPKRARQPALPGLEQPRNQKIEILIDRWHDAKGGFKDAGAELSASATLLAAGMEQEGVEAYQYEGKLITYKASAKKLSEKEIKEEAVSTESNGDGD